MFDATLTVKCVCSFKNDVAVKLNLLWKFVKPISFALIGKEVEFTKLDMRIVGCGIAIVLIASIVSLIPYVVIGVIITNMCVDLVDGLWILSEHNCANSS